MARWIRPRPPREVDVGEARERDPRLDPAAGRRLEAQGRHLPDGAGQQGLRSLPLVARTSLLLVLIGAIAALVSGCGSDDTTTTTTASAGATGASGASGAAGPGGEVQVTFEPPRGSQNAFGATLTKANKFPLIAGNLAKAFELPEDLTVYGVNGFGGGPFFNPKDNSITFQYGWANLVYNTFKQLHPEWTASQIGAGVGAVDSFILEHEFGHALIDIYDLPVLGKEEDAADDLATLLLIRAEGGDRFILDAAQFWAALSNRQATPGIADYADVHSLDLQRSLTMLCMLAGSSEANFQTVANIHVLPDARLAGCPGEYEDKAKSYDQVLDPHLEGDFSFSG
jgi:hypothetical protein